MFVIVKPAPLIFGGCVKESMPEGAECLNRISYAEYFRYFEMFHVEVRLDNLQYHCEDDDAHLQYYYEEYLDDNQEDYYTCISRSKG